MLYVPKPEDATDVLRSIHHCNVVKFQLFSWAQSCFLQPWFFIFRNCACNLVPTEKQINACLLCRYKQSIRTARDQPYGIILLIFSIDSKKRFSKALKQFGSGPFLVISICPSNMISLLFFPIFFPFFILALASLFTCFLAKKLFPFSGAISLSTWAEKVKMQLLFHHRDTMVPRTDMLYYCLS